MKIKSIDDSTITFDNGTDITFDHVADCCEYNYAAFEEIDDLAKNFEFSENLIFEEVPDSGFRFGNNPQNMVFVPCYSEQNGYYSSDVNIYYNDKRVLNVSCDWIDA